MTERDLVAAPVAARETPAEAAVDVTVLRSDPPRELIHRLGDQLLRWTLMPTPTGSRLTLEHTFDESSDGGQPAAGWHICLADLAVLLDGYAVGRVVGGRAEEFAWSKFKDRYHDLLT